jgi:arylsulfatase A-like enzyme
VEKQPLQQRTLTRREFLKIAGSAGAGLLGASVASSGCDRPPNRQNQINVVVVILDSLRKDHVGAYGNPWIKTPNLDTLAREGLRFTNAYPESLPTLCARRAIHTGFRTWPFRDWHQPKGEDVWRYGWQPIPTEQTTLAEILKGHGYQTMFVTDTLHQFKPSYNFHRGFDVFEFIRGQTSDRYRPVWTFSWEKVEKTMATVRDYMRKYSANTAGRKTEEDWFAPQVFARSSELLEAASEAQPFFMVVDGYDPHEPWDPPQRYVDLYDGDYEGGEPYFPREGSSDYLTERQLKRMRALYSAEVTMADRWLGRFLDKIDELSLFENTLIILLSDHGHALGEHKFVGKPVQALWPELTDIVFLMRHPEGKGAGKTSDYYASTHDVAPTILGILGIEPPEPIDGQDLSVVLGGGEPEGRDHFSLGYHNFVWARDEAYIYFSRNDGAKPKLYDVGADPEMRNNRAEDRPEVAKKMFEDYVLKDAGGPLPRY